MLALAGCAVLALALQPRPALAADFTLHGDDLAMHVDSTAVVSIAPESLATLASVAPESLAAFPAPRVRAWQVGVVRPDRLEHAGLSFTLGAAFTLAFRDRLPAAALTLALGAGKEYWDSRQARGSGSGAEALDLVADAVGLGLALVCVRGRAP
jgi:VanZ family protein